jgi:serine/threonine protein kinase
MTAPASPLKSISVSDPVLAELMDQLANRLQAGEPVDIEDVLRAHPERAEELRRLLPAVEILAGLERSLNLPSPSGCAGEGRDRDSPLSARCGGRGDGGEGGSLEAGTSPQARGLLRSAPETNVLGDFRIIREIGRGGMGVVYEAEQISLGRGIALKVLPFASTLDPRQLQRFRNEAHAAAQLHHTNIVPVFATGCERSVHFYAMQFIEGHTLAHVVNELAKAKETNGRATESTERALHTATSSLCSLCLYGSKDYFKMITYLGIQAAEALEYAHQMGIIHRDIKPANLLLENSSTHAPTPGANATRLAPDHSPLTTHHSLRIWITDFGLAHCQSQAGITMTGDLIGTLRYMSPEQALAKRVVVDHRTDIYSLGATLYELLTLQPAFPGDDRQQLLRQIAFDEPRPPRRIDSSIPPELETIVMKALEKNPADRFATAQDMADDLRRYLEDKPIRARQPSVRQRITKWARRHPAAVWAGVSALVIAVVALAISLVFIAQAQVRTGVALKEAKDNYETAKTNFQLAREAVDNFSNKVSQDPRLKEQDLEELRKSLLQSGVEFYGRIAKQPGFGEELDRERARAYLQLADLTSAIQSGPEAVQAAEQARDFLERLAREYPENPDYQRDLAISYCQLASCNFVVAPSDRDRLLLQHAIGILERLAEVQPANSSYRSDLARVYTALSSFYRNINVGEAERHFLKAEGILKELINAHPDPDFQVRLAGSCNNMVDNYLGQGRYDEAEAISEKARTLLENLVRMFPKDLDYQSHLAYAYNNIGQVNLVRLRLTKAEEGFENASRIWDRQAEEHPNLLGCKNSQGLIHVHLGKTNHLLARFDRSEGHYEKAVTIYQSMMEKQPKDVGGPGGVAWSSCYLGRLLKDKGDSEGSLQRLDRALADFEKDMSPPGHGIANALRRSWTRQSYFYRAEALNQLGRYGEAIDDWDRALGLATEQDTAYRAQEFRALARLGRASTTAYQGDYRKAASDAEDVLAKPPAGGKGLPFAASRVFSVAAAAVRKDGKLDAPVREKSADQYAARSLALLTEAQAEKFFETPLNFYLLKNVKDLDMLRDHTDFKTFLTDVEKSLPEENKAISETK